MFVYLQGFNRISFHGFPIGAASRHSQKGLIGNNSTLAASTAPLPHCSNKCRLDARKFPRGFKSPIDTAGTTLDEQLEKENSRLRHNVSFTMVANSSQPE
jgi:hypothetical protein